jgi:hypothetical protein
MYALAELIMFRSVLVGILFVVTTATGAIETHASMIALHSGNGSIGSADTKITFLKGPKNSPFGYAFTTADFASARAGASANIVNPHPNWKMQLGSDKTAKWISTSPSGASKGNTALYAIDFTVGPGSITSATLDFDFLVDNALGDSRNEGLFINGFSLEKSKLIANAPERRAFFQADQSFATFSITSLLKEGVNTLFINAADAGGPSGLQFSASINVQQVANVIAVPEPSSIAIWSLMGVFGLVASTRSRSRR